MSSTTPCDHTSVGALIFNDQGEILLFQRGTPPWGVAGPAGHRDGDSHQNAIVKEVREEVGLQVISVEPVAIFDFQKPCRRPSQGKPYHDWSFFLTRVEEGEPHPSQREIRKVRWYSYQEVLELMGRTEEYHLLGYHTEQEWRENPGLDLPWYRFFKEEMSLASRALRAYAPANHFVSLLTEGRL
jgi:8-oxo-dGTP pyrophosphatase MutT (NUDIX family)